MSGGYGSSLISRSDRFGSNVALGDGISFLVVRIDDEEEIRKAMITAIEASPAARRGNCWSRRGFRSSPNIAMV